MSINFDSDLVLTEEFQQALEYLNDGQNLFLTGKAGTGKSTLIRNYLATTSRKALVAAPTGIAALNVNGYTIHRLFSFTSGITVEHVRSKEYYPRRFARTLKQIDTLIIDEASMVRADLFDCLAIALERFGPRPGRKFGGVQLVLVGDLLQLPPVVTERESEYFTTRYETPYFFSADHFKRDAFPLIELTTVFRQLGDFGIIDILNSVREGALLDESMDTLNSRTDAEFESPAKEFWLTLTATNRIAGSRNKKRLDQLPGPELRHQASTSGDLDGFDSPTEDDLVYKVGAQIMLLNNDPSDHWVNGSMGKVVGAATKRGETVVSIELNGGSLVEVKPHTWEVTRPTVESGALRHEAVGSYTQLPFRLAWAITIHKSQGQTLDRLIVDLAGGTFAYGQLYVALSRCTSMQGLVLRQNVQPKDLKVDQRIRRFLRTGVSSSNTRGPVYIGLRFVGDEGRMWRPRPVEIALVTEDGQEITTLINPDRDMGDAQATFGLSATDVQLAPLLAEAWPALAQHLDGRIPVGIDVDRELGYLDYELKRNGHVVPIPLGIDLGGIKVPKALGEDLQSGSALARAHAIRRLAQGARSSKDVAEVFTGTQDRSGYLMARTRTPGRFVIGGHVPDPNSANKLLAQHLATALSRVNPTEETLDALRNVEAHIGQSIIPAEVSGQPAETIADVLTPGARVCFTGSATDTAGSSLSRHDLEVLAEAAGLMPVQTVTKSKCEALISADLGSQSGKAKTALKYKKPVFAVEDFLNWTRGESQASSSTTITRQVATSLEPVLERRKDATARAKTEVPLSPTDHGQNAQSADELRRLSGLMKGLANKKIAPVSTIATVSSPDSATQALPSSAHEHPEAHLPSPIELATDRTTPVLPNAPSTRQHPARQAVPRPASRSAKWRFHIIMCGIFLFLTIGMLLVGAVWFALAPQSQVWAPVLGISWIIAFFQIPVWIVWGIVRSRNMRPKQANETQPK